MATPPQLTPQMLAEVTSSVASAMLATELRGDDVGSWPPWSQGGDATAWRVTAIELAGEPKVKLVLCWPGEVDQTLGALMFSCAHGEVDDAIAVDAFGELLNIVAGQVKSLLGSDHALGLPRAEDLTNPTSERALRTPAWQAAFLHGGPAATTAAVRFWVAAAAV